MLQNESHDCFVNFSHINLLILKGITPRQIYYNLNFIICQQILKYIFDNLTKVISYDIIYDIILYIGGWTNEDTGDK